MLKLNIHEKLSALTHIFNEDIATVATPQWYLDAAEIMDFYKTTNEITKTHLITLNKATDKLKHILNISQVNYVGRTYIQSILNIDFINTVLYQDFLINYNKLCYSKTI